MVLLQNLALRLRVPTALVAVGTLLAACAPADAGTGIPPDLAASAASLDGVKSDIVADNVVTMDELEVAASLVRDCIAEHGVKVEEFGFENGDLHILMSTEATDDPVTATEGIDAIHDECFESHFALLSDIYNYQNRLTTAKRAELDDAWIACLNEHGLDIDRVDQISASKADQTEAVSHCAEHLEESGW